jgi:hypothetical protein
MLVDFLRASARARGPWNCSTYPADWCMALGHPDFAAPWRHLTGIAECEAIAAGGKLLDLWSEGIAGRIPVVTDPRAGDIGVIERAGLTAGAIYTGERWALRAERGVTFLPLPHRAVLRAWRPWAR